MTEAGKPHTPPRRRRLREAAMAVRSAFEQFLALPTAIIIAFIVFAVIAYVLDHNGATWLAPVRNGLRDHIFEDRSATNALLIAVAGGVISVMSITFAILLLAVQQSAASMSSQIFDQFLKRPLNQIYFGYIVGLAAYLLLAVAPGDTQQTPVFSATFALVFTLIAIYLILILVYHTIDQMRPSTVVSAIHDYVMHARRRQLALVRRTRRSSASDAPCAADVRADENGYVTGIDLRTLERALSRCSAAAEVELLVSMGSYLASGDPVAVVRGDSDAEVAALAPCVLAALRLAVRRDLGNDPAYGIIELGTIAWVSTSTAKSNPARAILIVPVLRDILSRWLADDDSGPQPRAPAIAVVYPDNLIAELLDALESLLVVASESMLYQAAAEVFRTLSMAFGRLDAAAQARAEDVVLRGISVLGDQPLTAPLEAALLQLIDVLRREGRVCGAAALSKALGQMRSTVGKLNSRSTRTEPQ